ncbi:MAG: methionyl-tRNA formyltransferase, partial [Oscillospiraceae bacterium]|nr:methionyl-tRNA formyltransferase [Oscillospiraceae bacterium]
TQSCYASMIRKEMSALDFEKSAQELHRIICGLTGFTKLDGKRLKVFRSFVCKNSGTDQENQNAESGVIIDPDFIIQCGGNTTLQFQEVQLEGGKRMHVKEFLRGKKLTKGQKLGE